VAVIAITQIFPQRDSNTPEMAGKREVKLTSADRVLWPGEGITKGDVFEYYGEIAPVIVPHLRDRPYTMKRWREGICGGSFFQKQAPKGKPSWVKTRRFRTHPREGGSRLVDFVLVNDEPTLLWTVQMHCIDMNAWYSRVDKPGRPDFVLFDLDPPDGEWTLAVEVAHLVRERLADLELESHVKTSGSTGIHVLAPIARRSSFEQTYEFAELVSRGLEADHPGMLTTEWLKKKREGVLVDHRQNGWGKTIASVYSVRPRPGAPVSTPLRWEELKPELDFRDFTMDAVLERVRRQGDLFEPVLHGRQALGPALKTLRRAAAGRPAARARAGRARSA
jgi:bifunctional non-homologous end joining protein LigD